MGNIFLEGIPGREARRRVTDVISVVSPARCRRPGCRPRIAHSGIGVDNFISSFLDFEFYKAIAAGKVAGHAFFLREDQVVFVHLAGTDDPVDIPARTIVLKSLPSYPKSIMR